MYYTTVICQVYMLTHLILDHLLKQQKSHIDLQQKFKNQAGLGMSLIWQSACLASIKAWVQSSAPSKSGGSGRKIRNSRLPWAVDQVWGTLGQHVSVSINKNYHSLTVPLQSRGMKKRLRILNKTYFQMQMIIPRTYTAY